jgi:hypothetical protein
VPDLSPLPKVCDLLSRHGAQYAIVGAQAGILHGYVRDTHDVDILVPEDEKNHARVIAALSELEDHAAAELTPKDFIENVIVKIADEVEVDVSTRAWKVSFQEAAPTAQRVSIEGVEIPFVALPILIASKETHRDQDQVDVRRLRALLKRQRRGEDQ